ncbi:hypothetical protein BJ508DRAFT_332053 [Ascobolus immersus RN42]|uniref:Mid2 domain-containing protein n=1 Tax=Ascobolus immersus RN42 TaxID=1160509 RepID=A0A3N4HRC4_ASCIM|nr:hypothetical protein BJ508DRAFT_332053 [Ascobolus immersus RN42]
MPSTSASSSNTGLETEISVSPPSTSPSARTPSTQNSGYPKSVVLGASIGAGLGGLLIAFLIVFLLLRRRNKRKDAINIEQALPPEMEKDEQEIAETTDSALGENAAVELGGDAFSSQKVELEGNEPAAFELQSPASPNAS